MKVQIVFFGVPKIIVNDQIVEFPFRKAEAIFYYLCIQKRVTRDELVHLFWSELKEETAKKNLRNALYQIKKTIGNAVIKTPKRTVVEIGDDIELFSDVEALLTHKRIEVYTGSFLQGYVIKNALNFDDWLLAFREHCRERFTEFAYENVESDGIKDIHELIRTMQVVIKVDPYDERAYRIIMQAYADTGQMNKSFKVFQALKTLLNEELGVEPDSETKKVFESLAMQRHDDQSFESESSMYGRRSEMDTLTAEYESFKRSKGYHSVLIEGEAGIGKTTLLSSFFERIELKETFSTNQNILLMQAICYQSEAGFYLKPWHGILERLIEISEVLSVEWPWQWKRILVQMFPSFAGSVISASETDMHEATEPDLQIHLLEDMIMQLFEQITQKVRIVLAIDDLQWMDEMSLSILTSLILQAGRSKIWFIGVKRSGSANYVRKMKSTLLRDGYAKSIYLSRFSKSDIKAFLTQKDISFSTDAYVDKIFEETEGNPFFIKEYLNALSDHDDKAMTPAMRHIIEGRFNDLSENTAKLLDLAACFSDKIEFGALSDISGRTELDLLESLDELSHANILTESGETGQYSFTHHKLREYIDEHLSFVKRKVLHLKVADWFAHNVKLFGYERVIYHYRQADERVKAMKYHLIYLEGFLNLEHELYPVIDLDIEFKSFRFVDNNRVMLWFKEVEDELGALEKNNRFFEQVQPLIMRLLLMQGRYYIREGQYEKGLEAIHELIELSENRKNYSFVLKGIRQIVNFSVQTYDYEMMRLWIRKAMGILEIYHDQEEEGMFKRLNGLSLMLMHRYEASEKEIKEAIMLFKAIDDKRGRYRLNIAACYNYLGDLQRMQKKFEKAIRNYDLAIEISELSGVSRCTSIFLTNAGQTAYNSCQVTQAKTYLEEAIKQFDMYGTLWKRAVAEGYMALVSLEEENVIDAINYLEKSALYSEKLRSPYAMGTFNKVCALFIQKLRAKKVSIQHPLIDKDPDIYMERAKAYFVKSSAEFELAFY